MPAKFIRALVFVAFGIMIGNTITIAPAEPPKKKTIACREPDETERLVVTVSGSSDGKPFCAYYPQVAWGGAK